MWSNRQKMHDANAERARQNLPEPTGLWRVPGAHVAAMGASFGARVAGSLSVRSLSATYFCCQDGAKRDHVCRPARNSTRGGRRPVSILQRVASVAAFGERLAYLARSACEQKARGHCSAPSAPRSLLRLARHELARRLDEDRQHEPVHRS